MKSVNRNVSEKLAKEQNDKAEEVQQKKLKRQNKNKANRLRSESKSRK